MVYTVNTVEFEWDHKKDESNQRKHGIKFNDAVLVFYDFGHIKLLDTKHSIIEERFNIIGYSPKGVLFLVYVIKQMNRYRIISARKATKRERRIYEEKNK